MIDKTCCVTGHRDIPADKVDYVREALQRELAQAIADGFTTFISGMADGVDLLFAQLVIEAKKQHPNFFLEAALPYANRAKSRDPLFRACLMSCDGIHIQQEAYTSACYLNHNRYMVSQSSRVIAVYDGRDGGGTLFTMRYAHTLGREVRVLSL